MKKLFAILLVFVTLFVLAACGEKPVEETPSEDIFAKSEGTMTYAEYAAVEANKDITVTIEAFIQARQTWWEQDSIGKSSFYLMDKDGGYFCYRLHCTQEEYNKLTVGTKVKITGKKAVYQGLNEFGEDATFEIMKGTWICPNPVELSFDEYNNNALKYQNQLFLVKNAEVVASEDAEGAEVAFLYNWNGSGEKGDDIYIKVKLGDVVQTIVIESTLCDKDSEVYKAAEALKVGDKINFEGFLYWYKGAQPHVTKITK